MAPVRKRSALKKHPTAFVSYKEAKTSGPAALKVKATHIQIISQFASRGRYRQRENEEQGSSASVVAAAMMTPPPVLERQDGVPPSPSAPVPSYRRSGRVPKRKRLSTSPEDTTQSKLASKNGPSAARASAEAPRKEDGDGRSQEVKVSTPITPIFFKGKEKFGAALMILVEPEQSSRNYPDIPVEQGWLQCGVCCNLSEINLATAKLSDSKKYGAFLCGQCVPFLNKLTIIARKAMALTCLGGNGNCKFPAASSCEACFIHNCLLLLDFGDELYFKLWRAVPPAALTNVPHVPPSVKRYGETRGKIIWVSRLDGEILHVAIKLGSGKVKTRGTVAFAAVEAPDDDDKDKTQIILPARVGQGRVEKKKAGRPRVKRNLIVETESALLKTDDAKTDAAIKVDVTEGKQIGRTRGRQKNNPTAGANIIANNSATIMTVKEECGTVNVSEKVEEESASVSQQPEEPEAESIVKVFPPLNPSSSSASELVGGKVLAKYGYPVVVVPGSEPPTPLCFSCGSAGINQLVYCFSCCEPFHPYCSDDDALLTAYLAEVSLRPATTGGLVHKFRKWKCSQCLTCSHCGCGRRDGEDDFIACSLCASSFHLRCTRKMPLKPATSGVNWVCVTCLHCSSCQIPLRSKNMQHLRKLGTAMSEILCLECFKRRRQGSFCPVCFVCYDDNDWDSKMMECDKCKRWIHAQCEELNDEKYYVLSALPEAIVYVCRLCHPPISTVGWRFAIESDLVDGCLRVLDLFQKKVVGVTRKRRALSFSVDEEDGPLPKGMSPYFSPSLVIPLSSATAESGSLPLQEKNNGTPTSCRDTASPSNKQQEQPRRQPTLRTTPLPRLSPDENSLIQRYNIRPCTIRLADLDTTVRRKGLMVKEEQETPPASPPPHPGEVTPIKNRQSLVTSPITAICTPSKMSTPHRVTASFTEAVKASAPLWRSGVRTFRSISLALLLPYFADLKKTSPLSEEEENEPDASKFVSYFEDTLKQVFPWWRDDLKELIKRVDDDGLGSSGGSSDNASVASENMKPSDPMKEELLPEAAVLTQCYWDEGYWMDGRACSLCHELGDFPLNSSGRLLNVNPEEWVHVNCAIWSSEVWEEEDGALQQVEVALLRGKRTPCDLCSRMGASLNCCAGSCRACFHFTCAMESGCILQEDKSVFCSNHTRNAKGQVQEDMHVTRKVYVSSLTSARRSKELVLPSSRLKMFVGSSRVDRLGRVVPISVINLGSKKHGCQEKEESENTESTVLQPVNFHVAYLRLVKPIEEGGGKYVVMKWQSVLNRFGDFRSSGNDSWKKPSNFSVVIDHTKRRDLIQLRIKEAQAFWSWSQNASKFIDEYNMEWAPVYTNPLATTSSRRTKKRRKSSKNNTVDNTSSCSSSQSQSQVYRASLEWVPPPKSRPEEEMLLHTLSSPRLCFLLEQLPGVQDVGSTYTFRYADPARAPEDVPASPTSSGCSRSEPFKSRRAHDMFNWLRSTHRKPPKQLLTGGGVSASEETVKSKGLPLAMRFRNLRERATKDLVVLPSHIHGRGLFAQRDIEVGEMLIEYAGEMIRSVLCDVRERKYELLGIGCYMFRVNRSHVVDATMKGNAARFINHSCDPNCESKAVKIFGKDHILIFALKNIGRGEELTYDYKFEREVNKLPCSCGSRKCRRFLN